MTYEKKKKKTIDHCHRIQSKAYFLNKCFCILFFLCMSVGRGWGAGLSCLDTSKGGFKKKRLGTTVLDNMNSGVNLMNIGYLNQCYFWWKLWQIPFSCLRNDTEKQIFNNNNIDKYRSCFIKMIPNSNAIGHRDNQILRCWYVMGSLWFALTFHDSCTVLYMNHEMLYCKVQLYGLFLMVVAS